MYQVKIDQNLKVFQIVVGCWTNSYNELEKLPAFAHNTHANGAGHGHGNLNSLPALPPFLRAPGKSAIEHVLFRTALNLLSLPQTIYIDLF